MVNRIIFVLFILMSFSLFAKKRKVNCKKHKVYCQIIKNSPRIDKKYAMKLSNAIHKYAKKYRINSRLYTSILFQESRYKLDAKNCTVGLRELTEQELEYKIKKCQETVSINNQVKNGQLEIPKELTEDLDLDETTSECVRKIPDYVKLKICFDFGLSQIHYGTVSRYGFDIDRLITDLDYSVEAGAIVLSGFKKRYSHKELDWWTRYNSPTRRNRDIYERLVKKWY